MPTTERKLAVCYSDNGIIRGLAVSVEWFALADDVLTYGGSSYAGEDSDGTPIWNIWQDQIAGVQTLAVR